MDPLSNLAISPVILRLIASLDEFKGRWQAIGRLAPDRLSALRRVATIESVGSSTRIEGARLTDAEVDRLLSRIDVRSFRSRDEQEVAGYAEAMELVFESWRELTLTENHVKQLHGLLLKHSTRSASPRPLQEASQPRRGLRAGWEEPGRRVRRLPPSTLRARWRSSSPGRTPRSRRGSSTRCSSSGHSRSGSLPSTIPGRQRPPFARGHDLLLLRRIRFAPPARWSGSIEENKDDYYRTLRRAQSTLDRGEKRLGEWLVFFLRCLGEQVKVLERKVEREQLMAALSALDEALLRLAKEHGR